MSNNPHERDVARAICCPDGCSAERAGATIRECSCDRDTFKFTNAGRSTKIIMALAAVTPLSGHPQTPQGGIDV